VELHPFLLIFELRRAADVLEQTLMTRLDEAGWPRLTINQVLLFAHLEPEGVTAAELARRMGMSRQSMQKNLDRLRDLDLVTVEPHPLDRRSSLVIQTSAGRRFAQTAGQMLDGFERRMEAALGTGAVNGARSVLTADLEQLIRTDQNASGR
jgi:DNA-binding MarR family transcriptional regulator